MSLEDLDPEDMEKVLFGALGGPVSRGGRDPRRTPINAFGQRLDDLLSLTEEEAGSESQFFSSLEVKPGLELY